MSLTLMGSSWKSWYMMHRESRSMLTKLLVSALLIGISFLFFYYSSSPIYSLTELPVTPDISQFSEDLILAKNANISNAVVPSVQIDVRKQDSNTEKCDIFSGKWIRDHSGPTYTNKTCSFIEDPQNCMKNGRLDTDYLYWRWKPNDCNLPPFNAWKFLKAMQNKSWAFIGDSILRNHAQSLICLLSVAESPVEISHDKDYKSRTWHFPSRNFTLSMVWSPFLVKADIFENDLGISTSEIQLHLNTVNSKWTENYHTYDYILMSVGQWFLKTAVYWENSKIIGCHNCPKLNLTERGLDYSYRKVLQSTFEFMKRSEHKPRLFYRTWTPDHFEYGGWSDGGLCNRTKPYEEGEYHGRELDSFMHGIEMEEIDRAGTKLHVLDTYGLSLLRPDGHPGAYRNFHPFEKDVNAKVQNDCLHWCLPGPIDTWNDLLMNMVVDG